MANKSKASDKNINRQLDERLLELAALFEISRSLTSSLNIRAVLGNILRIPMGHFLISRGLVMLRQGNSSDYSVAEVKGMPRNILGKTLRLDSFLAQTVLLEEKQTKGPLAFFSDLSLGLIIPLCASQTCIGLVAYGDKITGIPFTQSEVEFLDSISNIAATAVSNSLNVEEIQKVNRTLDQKLQQLNTIFDINQELNTTLDRGMMVSLLAYAVMGELLVNRCAVYLLEKNSMLLVLNKGGCSLPDEDNSLSGISTPLLLEETQSYSGYREAGLSLFVPLKLQDDIKGILALGPKISGEKFEALDLEFLTILGNQAITSIENTRLFEAALEMQRMEEELNLARNIQKGLLPSILPEWKGYQIAAINLSSREVGGDYYDVIHLEGDHWGIAIADVSGKGAGAAMLMSNLQAGLRALLPGTIGLAEMVHRVNLLIHHNTSIDKFITFFYGELDTRSGIFQYCNAGHNPPFLVSRQGKVKELTEGGLILGMMPESQYETGRITIRAGDRLVFYTDGITEAMDEKYEEFGEERVKNIVSANPQLDAEGLLETISTEVQAHAEGLSQQDDITMIVIRKI